VPCRFVALHASVAFAGGIGGDVEQMDVDELNEEMAELYRIECARNGVDVSA
jgi:hypothetical protein